MSTALADLFAELWIELEASPDWQAIALRHEVSPKGIARQADEFARTLAASGLAAADQLRARRDAVSAAGPARIETVLLLAQAIDRWHAPLVAEGGEHQTQSDDQLRARLRLRKEGRLNAPGSGRQVIFKRPLWGRWANPDLHQPEAPEELSDIFEYIVVVVAEIPATAADDQHGSRMVKLTHRYVGDEGMLLPLAEDKPPVIGFAPLAWHIDELDVAILNENGLAYYDVQATDLAKSATEAIAELCDRGAHIIVFPEMTVQPATLAAIKAAITRYGPDSELRLVIAGTSRCLGDPGAKPFNEARLFNHRGQELGRQRKLHRWNLDADLSDRYAIHRPDHPVPAQTFEYITPGDEVLVLEQAQFGRIVVLICEDLGRSQPGRWLCRNMFVDWVIAPILDSSLETERWTARCGTVFAQSGRSRVIVANSLPLTLRQNAQNSVRGRRQRVISHCGIGLCIDQTPGGCAAEVLRVPVDAADRTVTVVWTPHTWKALGTC